MSSKHKDPTRFSDWDDSTIRITARVTAKKKEQATKREAGTKKRKPFWKGR